MVQSLKDAELEVQANSVVNITQQENNEFKLIFFVQWGGIFPCNFNVKLDLIVAVTTWQSSSRRRETFWTRTQPTVRRLFLLFLLCCVVIGLVNRAVGRKTAASPLLPICNAPPGEAHCLPTVKRQMMIKAAR